MRPWVLTRPYLNRYCLVSRPVECLHGPQVPSGTLELLVALLVQTQHVTRVLVVHRVQLVVGKNIGDGSVECGLGLA
jgi:hypothetical protein